MVRNGNLSPNIAAGPHGANYKAVLRYDSRTKMHIAYTPGLVYAQADTPDRAKRTLEGAMALFVAAAQKSRSLTAMLDGDRIAAGDPSPRARDEGAMELWIS